VLAERGLIGLPHVLAEFELAEVVVLRRIEHEGQQADHHALLRLRRVPREGELVVGITVGVEV